MLGLLCFLVTLSASLVHCAPVSQRNPLAAHLPFSFPGSVFRGSSLCTPAYNSPELYLVSDPTDCYRFYSCSKRLKWSRTGHVWYWTAHRMVCPAGTYFGGRYCVVGQGCRSHTYTDTTSQTLLEDNNALNIDSIDAETAADYRPAESKTMVAAVVENSYETNEVEQTTLVYDETTEMVTEPDRSTRLEEELSSSSSDSSPAGDVGNRYQVGELLTHDQGSKEAGKSDSKNVKYVNDLTEENNEETTQAIVQKDVVDQASVDSTETLNLDLIQTTEKLLGQSDLANAENNLDQTTSEAISIVFTTDHPKTSHESAETTEVSLASTENTMTTERIHLEETNDLSTFQEGSRGLVEQSVDVTTLQDATQKTTDFNQFTSVDEPDSTTWSEADTASGMTTAPFSISMTTTTATPPFTTSTASSSTSPSTARPTPLELNSDTEEPEATLPTSTEFTTETETESHLNADYVSYSSTDILEYQTDLEGSGSPVYEQIEESAHSILEEKNTQDNDEALDFENKELNKVHLSDILYDPSEATETPLPKKDKMSLSSTGLKDSSANSKNLPSVSQEKVNSTPYINNIINEIQNTFEERLLYVEDKEETVTSSSETEEDRQSQVDKLSDSTNKDTSISTEPVIVDNIPIENESEPDELNNETLSVKDFLLY